MRSKSHGQIQISFGMIFSIIIIICVIVVGGIIINNFLTVKNCTQLELLSNKIQDKVLEAYNSQGANFVLNEFVPSKVEYLCFGSLSITADAESKELQTSLKKTWGNTPQGNMFYYPFPKNCDRNYGKQVIKQLKSDKFFCVPSKDGKVSIKISFDIFDSGVEIKK